MSVPYHGHLSNTTLPGHGVPELFVLILVLAVQGFRGQDRTAPYTFPSLSIPPLVCRLPPCQCLAVSVCLCLYPSVSIYPCLSPSTQLGLSLPVNHMPSFPWLCASSLMLSVQPRNTVLDESDSSSFQICHSNRGKFLFVLLFRKRDHQPLSACYEISVHDTMHTNSLGEACPVMTSHVNALPMMHYPSDLRQNMTLHPQTCLSEMAILRMPFP